MKKVLIISYFFPPRPNIGSQRPYRLAKYFPKFGWEPTILTANLPGKSPEGRKIIETDYKDISSSIKSKIGFLVKGFQLAISVSKNYNYSTGKIIRLLSC